MHNESDFQRTCFMAIHCKQFQDETRAFIYGGDFNNTV